MQYTNLNIEIRGPRGIREQPEQLLLTRNAREAACFEIEIAFRGRRRESWADMVEGPA